MTDEWISAGWRELDAPPGFRSFAGTRDSALLMISRPSRHNALTLRMWAALPSLLASFSSARALLVTGDGDSFSAGADIGELQSIYGDPAEAAEYHAINVAAEQALALMPCPTIAVVRGACVGGGCQLAVACDLRLASAEARFGITPAKLGVVYPAVPTLRLARLVGPSRAKYLLFTADLIDASTALTFGLVDEVVLPSSLVGRATELAGVIASRSRQTIGAASAVLSAVEHGGDPDEAIAGYLELARRAPDVTEGLAAFLEGRRPSF
jgi:enoyl-CoA hydratase/carnithine racemase